MKSFWDKKKLLILAPHTDDGELGCGATIAKAIREGAIVYYMAFSICEDSIPEGMPKDALLYELYDAINQLGINKDNVFVKRFKVRHFSESRQVILDDMIEFDKLFSPDIIFMPSPRDVHQDHQTIVNEGLRAFKKKTIISYQLPWNQLEMSNQMFVEVEHCDVDKKKAALHSYKTQVNRPYMTDDYIMGSLITNGVKIGRKYAEVYEMLRFII